MIIIISDMLKNSYGDQGKTYKTSKTVRVACVQKRAVLRDLLLFLKKLVFARIVVLTNTGCIPFLGNPENFLRIPQNFLRTP